MVMKCGDCGTSEGRIIRSRRFNIALCSSCYQIWSAAGGKPIEHPLPPYAEVQYDDKGYPICHICGRAYKKLLSHVWQKHGMTEKEYKEKFGLDRYKGIIAPITKNKLQIAVKKHYSLVVEQNLIKGGLKTRFTKGMEGRTIDKCSPQTLYRLKTRQLNGKFTKKGDTKHDKVGH